MRLKNKTVIVTGSGRGMGKAFALALAKEGAKTWPRNSRSKN